MGLFGKRCEYCGEKIEKGKEIRKDVGVSDYVGTHPKNFCCNKHIIKYEQELEEYMNKPKKGGGGCCR